MPSKRSPITKKYCVSPAKALGRKGAKRGGQASGVRRQENSQTALRARWYVLRLVDDPVASPVPRLFPESTKIPIAHNRFTYPTPCISVHECPSAVGFSALAKIRVHQRLEKQPNSRSFPSSPPPLSPQPKPWGEGGPSGGGQASGFRLQENSQTALLARWYVPRLVDDPVASPVQRLFPESTKIPIAHNRFTFPTPCISVHECASAVGFLH